MSENMTKPNKWNLLRLDEVFQIARGGSPRPIIDYITEEDGYNWIKIGDTKNVDKYIYKTKQKIRKEGLKKSLLVKEDDFILSNSMSFGKPYIMKTEGCIHDGWLLLRKLKKDISVDFMYYVLSSDFIKTQFISKAAGSTVQNLNIKLVETVKALIPPLPEQQKIAEILSTVDDKIEVIDQQIIETQELKKGLMQRLLTKGIGHTEFKDSPLGEIPKSWNFHRLDEVFQIARGGSPRPIIDYITDEEDGYNWIKIGDTKNIDKYIYKTRQKILREGLKKSLLVKEDDFILSNSMSFGKPYIMKTEGCIHDGWLLLRKLKEDISVDFMYYVLSSDFIKTQFISKAAGSTVQNLNIKLVETVNVLIPLLPEQQKIAEILSSVDEKIVVLLEKKTHYEELKQGLMQQLLTGKIRVKV